MNWPKEYLRAIRSGEIQVSRKVRAVYERECAWMDSPPAEFPYYFDEAAGQRHIDFMQKFCRQSKGKSGKKTDQVRTIPACKITADIRLARD